MHSASLDPSQLTLLTLPLQRRTDDDAEEYDLTADFTCVRLPGDRKGIENQTKVWDKVIVDRSKELRSWVDVYQQATRRGATKRGADQSRSEAQSSISRFQEV